MKLIKCDICKAYHIEGQHIKQPTQFGDKTTPDVINDLFGIINKSK